MILLKSRTGDNMETTNLVYVPHEVRARQLQEACMEQIADEFGATDGNVNVRLCVSDKHVRSVVEVYDKDIDNKDDLHEVLNFDDECFATIGDISFHKDNITFAKYIGEDNE